MLSNGAYDQTWRLLKILCPLSYWNFRRIIPLDDLQKFERRMHRWHCKLKTQRIMGYLTLK